VDDGSFDPDGNPITLIQVPSGPYQLGTNAVLLIVRDSLGASNICSATVTVVDTTPPTINCPGKLVATNDPGQCSALVNFVVSASDACGLSDLSCDIPSGTVFPVGTTKVTCAATDTSSNRTTCTFTVTVEDREGPLVACQPAPNPSGKNIPVAGANPSSGQNPDGYYELLAKDNCDPAPLIYVYDTASSFVAGPFHSGDIVKLRQNPGGTPTFAPGNPPIAAEIHLNGEGLAYGTDADGNVSANPCLMLMPPKPK